jgi:hypothetical protein
MRAPYLICERGRKIMKKIFISLCLWLIIFTDSCAFDLNLSIEPSLLKPNNSLLFSCQIFSCKGQKTCPPKDEVPFIVAPHFINSTLVIIAMNLYKAAFSALDLPAYSQKNQKDSYLSYEFYQGDQPLNLPNCKDIIITGKDDINIHISPSGCTVN